MAADVQVPAIGRVDKRWVLAGGAAVAGVVGYAWWRQGTAVPAGEAPAEDAALLDDVEGTDDGGIWPFRPGGSTVPSEPVDPATRPPATNAEWTTRAVTALSEVGYEPRAIAAALGKFLSRQALNKGEAEIVQTARAMVGREPTGDLPIIMEGTTTSPPPTPAARAWRSYRTVRTETMRQLMTRANPGVKNPPLHSWIQQAATRSRVGVDQRLKPGTWVTIYAPV